MNMQKAADILNQLKQFNVEVICLCPGARNAPFVKILSEAKVFEVVSFFDERSAGFFALGRARRDNKPVVICTTSGTAVSELLSPVIEAFYSDTPLIVLSADRPKRLRGTGAPQTIHQNQIFENFVEKTYDFEAHEEFKISFTGTKPIHINICFDEPLIDLEVSEILAEVNESFNESLKADLKGKQGLSEEKTVDPVTLNSNAIDKGSSWLSTKAMTNISLIAVGALKKEQRESVELFLLKTKLPILAESLSGLKDSAVLKDHLLKCGDKLACEMIKSGDIKSVLRIGDVPVGRFWRDLDLKKIPVINLSDKNFSGLDASEVQVSSLLNFEKYHFSFDEWDWSEWKDRDQKQFVRIQKIIEEFPLSEVSLINQLQIMIPIKATVYLGNSLPVREWDLVSQRHDNIFASRGVNGIDGQLSTAIGLHSKEQPTWAVLGDLTTLYDFSGFWLSDYIKKLESPFSLVVINNKGGQIFSRLFKEKLFLNEHNLNFQNIAQMWGWDYFKVTDFTNINVSSKLNLIELIPDIGQTQQFWKKYDIAWTI